MKIMYFIIIYLFFVIGCSRKNEENKTEQNVYKNNNQLILINKKFLEAVKNNDTADSSKIKNAFRVLKIFEPIIYSLIPGDINHKLVFNQYDAGGDFADFEYNSSFNHYSFSLINSENIFAIDLPSYPKKIINKWKNGDTLYYQSALGHNSSVQTESIYSYTDKKSDTIYVLNGNVEMINLKDHLDLNDNYRFNLEYATYFEILNSLINEYCDDSLLTFYKIGQSDFWDFSKGNYENKIKQDIIEYGICNNNSGQIPFKSKTLSYAEIKIFPRYKARAALNITTLSAVHGINQFFMDHDLTSGFVHPYTSNFFELLPADGYVLVFERSQMRINQGRIYYKKKADLSFPSDELGQNLAFCRQWKLSDFDLNGFQVMMKKSTYKQGEYCPQLKSGRNPFTPDINEIPIWSTYAKEGYVDYRLLNSLTDYDGGTAVIIWANKEDEILFMDIHGSIADILTEAIRIKEKYNTDPSIGIYDAGTFARKFKADANGNIDFQNVNKLTGKTEFVGAGYGYLK